MKKLIILALVALTWYFSESLQNDVPNTKEKTQLACVPCGK